ncbi:MAG: spermidine/putrescine ABC transporter substrate-binding protein [Firmicutes bacterium HGW-Firmicutes-16]|nr:MAG: spermidine/putrescine ABC transporter substrate-binding protein [Firmicutes bacterium HGW-Firmicutes-16]
MKKTVSIVICAIMLACLFSGCGGGKAAKVVNVYNWGEYIDTDLLEQFENETGIKVNYKTYESNEQMYSVLKQGGVSYDVVIPSDYMVSRLINEDMLEPLNFANIPNYSLIEDSLKNMAYDAENKYSVPYMWGTVGIIYDSTVVGEVDSWSALFDEKNSGNILMFDNSRDAMAIALKYLGYSMNTTDENELNKAYELLEKQKPILQGYVMDQIFDKLESGEAAIGPYYAGDYLTMHEANPNLKFCIPKEGSNVFVDAMCVLKNAENKDNAEAFINFMSGTQQSMANSEIIGYTSPNKEVGDVIDIDDFTKGIMYPDGAALAKCEAYINLPQETLNYYDKMWVELKS